MKPRLRRLAARLPLPASARVIAANAGSLVGTTAVTSALGALFWALAARTFSPASVGLASVAVSSMTLLSMIGALGFGTLLMGRLSTERDDAGPLVATALTVTATASALLGGVFALLVGSVSSNLAPLSDGPIPLALFTIGTGLAGASLVLDQSLLGLLRGGLQLGRNTVFAVAKLLLLIGCALALSHVAGMTIYAAWVLGSALSLLVLLAYTLPRIGRLGALRPRWALVRGLGRSALGHHTFNLALQAPSLVLPLVVATVLSIQSNASFYIAWMIAAFLMVVPISLCTTLFAVAGSDRGALAEKVRFTLSICVGLGLAANVAMLPLAEPILRVFGERYVEAAGALRILCLGLFPLTVQDHFVAICRIDGRVARVAPVIWAISAAEVGAAAFGAARGGLTGLALGYVAVLLGGALLMLPTVIRGAGLGREQARAVRVRA